MILIYVGFSKTREMRCLSIDFAENIRIIPIPSQLNLIGSLAYFQYWFRYISGYQYYWYNHWYIHMVTKVVIIDDYNEGIDKWSAWSYSWLVSRNFSMTNHADWVVSKYISDTDYKDTLWHRSCSEILELLRILEPDEKFERKCKILST